MLKLTISRLEIKLKLELLKQLKVDIFTKYHLFIKDFINISIILSINLVFFLFITSVKLQTINKVLFKSLNTIIRELGLK